MASKTQPISSSQKTPSSLEKHAARIENDEPIYIRPSQLRQIIKDTIEKSFEDIRFHDAYDPTFTGNRLYREDLEKLPAGQIKILADQKAMIDKVTIPSWRW